MNPEEDIRELREAGDLAGAATRSLKAYGAEVLGFLVGMLHDQADAEEVFAQSSHDLWVGMPSFRGETSMRTWLYMLARHAASRHLRAPQRRGAPLSQVSELVAQVRTETAPYLRSEFKDRFAVIRASLDPDDQWLLVLRVSRKMSWVDIARVLASETINPTEEDLQREAARLRKRYQKVKEIIRDRALAAGLVQDE